MKKIIISVATLLALQNSAQVNTFGGPFSRWMGLAPLGGMNGITSVGFGGQTITQSRFHIYDFNWPLPLNGSVVAGSLFRTDGNNNVRNQWQFFTGPSNNLTEKFKLFVNANSLDAGLQSTSAQMFFNTATTNGAAPAGIAERMRLSYGIGGNLAGGFNTPGVTKVLISHDGFGPGYLPPAVAMLNIGSSTPNPSAGSRPWMDIGTYYSMHTDNMYVGMKDAGSANNVRAVINWGDDPANTNSNNRLLYVFTGFSGQGQSSSNDGLEVGRMWASANAGRMGIGGDPVVNLYSIGNDPSNTLEVNSPTAFAPNVVGTSGLRFTDLRSNSQPQPNPGTGVLSVDASGDVILVPGSSGISSASNGLVLTPAGVVQLGGACNNIGELIASSLVNSRAINIGNNDFWFADGLNTTGGVGIGEVPASVGFCGTGNTFEVSANSKNTKYGNTNASGMRFTKLKSSSPTIPNGTNGVNSAKVLTVDGDGDVVLTDATGGTAFGNICGAAVTSPLTNNWEIPLNGHNYIFSGNNLAADRVGIGNLPVACAPQGKLHVENATGTGGARIAGAFRNTGVDNNSVGYAAVVGGSNVTGTSLLGNTGGSFNASGSPIGNTGVAGSSQGATNGRNYGGSFTASNGATNNYAVYASAPVGPNDWAGYFNANVFINGTGTSISPNLVFSDKNLKRNVTNVAKPMDLILKLRPVTFNMDNSYAPQLNVDNAKTYGLIAQEVGAVIPELVKDVIVPAEYDSLGTVTTPSVAVKGLNYTGLIPIAISGIQEINSRQNLMQEQIDKAGLSDAQVKTNLNNFNALTKVKTLNPVSYHFTNATVPQLNFKSNLEYGFVAQQLETVYPELVDTVNIPATQDSLGNVINASKTLKTVNYKAMTALLARSIQEQQLIIDSLRTSLSKQDSINQAVQQQLTNLSNLINNCCSNNSRTSGSAIQNQLDVELSDKDMIVLNQNVPNPFAEQTTITYNVPQSVGKAQLLFYNSAGQIIQTLDIKTRGKGKVNVFASDLSGGLYHYTLVADGKVVDSKKMVRE